jgi:hypothetical protein
MSSEPESFLARWSRRKRAAEEARKPAEGAVPETPAAAPAQVAGESVAPASASVPAPTRASAETTEVPLPPIESLDGLRSDYQAFFQQPVADELRHAALKKLFADPHFNKMDMLDVYVDDYTQFEPLPAAMKLRLPSARSFLSESERAELEAIEARTEVAGGAIETSASDPSIAGGAVADPERRADERAADDASADSTSGPSATTTATPAALDAPDAPSNASSPTFRLSGGLTSSS